MDHNQLNHNMHWGYGNPPPGGPSRVAWTPPTRGVKHAISESDCDDVFSEGSTKEQCAGDTDSCQMLSRKKRRGVIEKKRRDRINTSLTELKRLVPTAYEKQGSAKLEKAEILQMTVDHLKMLHAKGLDNLAYDPHKFAMDYHIIGFRECAAEVARYLVTIEGMDIQDPLRLRLMSHLQCFVTQRELAAKQSAAASSAAGAWSYPAPPPPPPPLVPSTGGVANAPQHYSMPSAPTATSIPNSVNLLQHHQSTSIHHQHPNIHDPSLGHYDISTSCASSPTNRHQTVTSTSHPTSSTLTPLTSTTPAALGYSPHQYHNLNSYPPTTSSVLPNLQNYNNQSSSSSQMKPYRPWGAEVAY